MKNAAFGDGRRSSVDSRQSEPAGGWRVTASSRPSTVDRRPSTRSRSQGAAILLLLLYLFACVAGCDSLPGKPTEAAKPLRPAQVVDFDSLYADNCSGCHGADGTLGGARPLNDPVYLAYTDQRILDRTIAVGVPNSLMPGFAITSGGTLTDQQIDILSSGIYQRWAKPDVTDGLNIPTGGTAPGDAQRGGGVYGARCASCHGSDGTGGEKGGSVVDGSYLALVSDRALLSAVICGRTDLGMPDWRGAGATPMTDQDVADVVAWLTAKRPKFPGQPYGGSS